jgi:pyrroloquinoline quinone biosynthesis protein D
MARVDASWPKADSVPVRREGASGVELDDNIAVYDDVGQLMILLNSSAAAVWNLCDGTRTVGEMVAELAETYPDGAAVIRDDVRETLRKLAEIGLVSEGSEAL